MRVMMRSLLADRFRLAVHNETREVPVLAFVLSKAGKIGPRLRPHLEDSPCQTSGPPPPAPGSAPSPPQTVAGGLPALCNAVFPMPTNGAGRLRYAGRNVTIGFIADSLTGPANLGSPMIDQTGLTGTVDFTLEWAREIRRAIRPGVDLPPDSSGPSFEEALQEQLGIKLRSQKSSMSVLVVDHVERPSEN